MKASKGQAVRRSRNAFATPRRTPAPRLSLLLLVALALCTVGLCGCSKKGDQGKGRVQLNVSTQFEDDSQQPRRLLELDDLRGGHTLARHVGKSDAELRERLRHEQISAASTYSDQATAEAAVGAALDQNRERINRWMARQSGHPNLVLDYDSGNALGRTLHRSENKSRPCSNAIVVLKWDGPGEYHVVTSYPECR